MAEINEQLAKGAADALQPVGFWELVIHAVAETLRDLSKLCCWDSIEVPQLAEVATDLKM
jgi:hypothetical protein